MSDLLYVTLSIAFFALMLAYLLFCRALGRRNGSEAPTP